MYQYALVKTFKTHTQKINSVHTNYGQLVQNQQILSFLTSVDLLYNLYKCSILQIYIYVYIYMIFIRLKLFSTQTLNQINNQVQDGLRIFTCTWCQMTGKAALLLFFLQKLILIIRVLTFNNTFCLTSPGELAKCFLALSMNWSPFTRRTKEHQGNQRACCDQGSSPGFHSIRTPLQQKQFTRSPEP